MEELVGNLGLSWEHGTQDDATFSAALKLREKFSASYGGNMNIDTWGEVIKALKRIETGELQAVLTVVECYSNPLMLALAMSIRGELASRMGWSRPAGICLALSEAV